LRSGRLEDAEITKQGEDFTIEAKLRKSLARSVKLKNEEKVVGKADF